jgi:hypothetical protein
VVSLKHSVIKIRLFAFALYNDFQWAYQSPISEESKEILFYPCVSVCSNFSQKLFIADAWDFSTLFVLGCNIVRFIFLQTQLSVHQSIEYIKNNLLLTRKCILASERGYYLWALAHRLHVNCFNTWIDWLQMFVCFESHEQFFSYLATVTITGDRAAYYLDLCLALICLMAFTSEGSFMCHTYCDTGPLFLRSYPKDPWFSLLNAVLLAKEQSLPILNILGLTQQAWAGLELMTSRMLSENTTTRLPQLKTSFVTCLLIY